MGARTRSFANLLNTDGTFLSGAINNSSLSGLTDIPSAAKSDLVPIIGYGLGSDAAMEHIDGGRSGVAVFNSTYDAYCFIFTNIHPSNDDVNFQFNMSTDSGSTFAVTKTTTAFWTAHSESGTGGSIVYDTSNDQAQSTGYSNLFEGVGADNDQSISGEMWVFNPGSTTYVKHFYSRFSVTQQSDLMRDRFYAGYGNTTSAINGIVFRFSAGTLQSGNIRVYGLK